MFHVLAQMANLLLPLVKGARVVYLETLNTTELLRALQERQITAFAVVPQFFYLIHERIFKEVAQARPHCRIAAALPDAREPLPAQASASTPASCSSEKFTPPSATRMRYLITGGSRFDPVVARDFHDFGIDLLNAYGLTETSAAAFLNRPGHVVIGSVGPPLPTIEAKILDPQPSEEGGQPVGEILIRGAIVMKGYWNRPDATAEALKDGWLHTGDLGYFDSGGNLFITGRRKELIVLANGKNIYPEEIEAHYLKSPYIKEICVMGLEAKPGDPNSERLYAVVVPNFDVLKERKIVNAKEVIRFDIEGLSQQLASTKRIGNYEIWQEDLPRTTTRKLKRFEIEKRVRANQAEGTSGEAEVPAERPMTPEDEAWLEKPEVQRALGGHPSRTRAMLRTESALPTISNSISDSTPCSASNCWWQSKRNSAATSKRANSPKSTRCATWSMPCSKARPAARPISQRAVRRLERRAARRSRPTPTCSTLPGRSPLARSLLVFRFPRACS